jgi:hypothetical protein
MRRTRYSAPACPGSFVFAMVLGLLLPTLGAATPCIVTDNGSGTVDLPPNNCGYVSPADFHMIINGLPPGTTINVGVEHEKFLNVIHTPGGPLGGEVENFNSSLQLHLSGTGAMLGYARTLTLQANCVAHTGPRVPGSPVQSFPTDMFGIQGQLPGGDPDFDLLRITAGSGFGMPSPGHTTLTLLQNGNWNVDSFFDIEYRIDFVGHPGGPFTGMSGSTTGTIRMGTGQPAPPACALPDNGTGTVDLPPLGCGYLSPDDVHKIINGLPAGTTIRVGAEHMDFFGITTTPGGSLGGEVEQFSSNLKLNLSGTGSLAGFARTLNLQTQCETHTAPRTPGMSIQSFDTDMFRIQGQLPPGDPDFDLLRITAGTAFGLPSPGHTTLTKLPGGNWNLDSFFDITYRIDFVGHPGGPLGGMSGSTTGTIRMKAGQTVPAPLCIIPDDGTGTVNLPPLGCEYLSPADVHQIINGLPPGTTINLGAQHAGFFNVAGGPGGTLGGDKEEFDSSLLLQLAGTGSLAGFSRSIKMTPHCETHVAPRVIGKHQQSFDTDMYMLQTQITGDPDFDLLRITAGTGFGMPSPGHTTLTRLTSGDWNVDSFFDITYRIDFVGHPGSPLGGMSGSTTGTIRMATGGAETVGVPHGPVAEGDVKLSNRPSPFGAGTTVEYRLPTAARVHLAVFDIAGRRISTLVNETMPAGPHAMFWDGMNDSGRKAGSGTYLIKLSLDGKVVATRRTMLVR